MQSFSQTMKESMDRFLVINAIESAVKRRIIGNSLTLHSDRGSQYCSFDVRKTCEWHGITQSMSGTGNCYDNAVTETFFSSPKKELVYQTRFKTIQEAKNAIFEWIEVFYNRTRLHSSLGYLSPLEYEAKAA